MEEELLSLINYYRLQPIGFFACGQDYGYGEDHTEARSMNADKILTLWKINSGWNQMVEDFRGFLISKYAEHDNDDKPIEGISDDQEYSFEINISVHPQYAEYFNKKGYNFDKDDNYTMTISFNSKDSSIKNNSVEIRLYEQHLLSSPAHYFRYLRIGERYMIEEFYFSPFNTEEELNTKIKNALDDDET